MRKAKERKRRRLAPFLVAAVCGLLLAGLWWAPTDLGGWRGPLRGLAGTVLMVDLVVCLVILLGPTPFMTVWPLVSSEERARWRRLRQRPTLADEAFIERFYAGSGIPPDIPLRLRRIYADELAMDNLWPEDKAVEFYPDLDLVELLYEVEEEFGVKFPSQAIRHLGGSFDSVVRYVASQRAHAGRD